MKKIISILLTILMTVCCFSPYYAFAEDCKNDDAYFTQEEFESFEHTYAIGITSYTNGLITDRKLGIAKKDATTLIIKGYTYGNNEVKKCGFTKVIIQRKKSSENSWSNYKTYNDLFSESNSYTLNKSVAVEKGFQYRAKATHYAKKSLLSTQKIDSTTGSLTF